MVMGPLEDSYWVAAVAEREALSQDNSSDTQANICYYCAEEGNDRPLLNLSYLENPMMRQSKMNEKIVLEDETPRSESTQLLKNKSNCH